MRTVTSKAHPKKGSVWELRTRARFDLIGFVELLEGRGPLSMDESEGRNARRKPN